MRTVAVAVAILTTIHIEAQGEIQQDSLGIRATWHGYAPLLKRGCHLPVDVPSAGDAVLAGAGGGASPRAGVAPSLK